MLSNGIINVILECLNMLFIMIFMFFVNVKLSLVVLSGLPIFAVIMMMIKKRQRKAWQDVSNKSSNLNAYLQENITGARVTQIFTREEENAQIFDRLSEKYRKSWINAVKYSNLVWPATDNVSTLVRAAIFVVGLLVLTPAAESGAFTGEISALMLKEMGVEYVVLGHSERRQYFGETDETVNKRTKAALAAGLKPIVCVGELLWERECDITEEVIARQIKLDLFNVTADELKNIVIAYEPVWAIGTGKTATADQAEEVCAFIRATIAKLYSQADADAVTIQYGGSMNDGNADELLSKTNVDGGLIGGASLVAEKFAAIVKAASK